MDVVSSVKSAVQTVVENKNTNNVVGQIDNSFDTCVAKESLCDSPLVKMFTIGGKSVSDKPVLVRTYKYFCRGCNGVTVTMEETRKGVKCKSCGRVG